MTIAQCAIMTFASVTGEAMSTKKKIQYLEPKPDPRVKIIPTAMPDPVPVPEGLIGSYITCGYCKSYVADEHFGCPRCTGLDHHPVMR